MTDPVSDSNDCPETTQVWKGCLPFLFLLCGGFFGVVLGVGWFVVFCCCCLRKQSLDAFEGH